ncbi:MAG: DUF2867 domain-containing protein [Chloroflexota bacterium]|nr:DUF2867 domain-containing protein [Chloroflexota bacterium]
MYQPDVQKVDLPTETLAALAFPRIDYADAYRMRLPASVPNDIDAVARAALGTAPRWIVLLMRLRDWLAGMIGLKTARQLARSDPGHNRLQVGDRLGIFKVFDRRADELLLGEDDRHLDFRVSVLVRNDGSANWAIISTVVRFNSWLGRAYFLPVRPFHKLIVPAMMRHAYQRYSTQ